MMKNSIMFEDFSDNTHPPEPPIQSDAPISDNNPSYDQGYKAGWDDAIASLKTEESQVNSAIATALQEARFTYFEARQHVLKSLHPVLTAVTEHLLPNIANVTLIPIIIEEIMTLANSVEGPITVACSPELAKGLQQLISSEITFPVSVAPEQTLTSTQVILRFSDGEVEIDPLPVIAAIEAAVAGFYSLIEKEEGRHA